MAICTQRTTGDRLRAKCRMQANTNPNRRRFYQGKRLAVLLPLDCPPKVIAPLIWLDQSGNHLYIRKALRGHCCILSTVVGSLVTCKCFANHTVYHHANHTVYHHGNHTVYHGRHLHLLLERLLQPISCYNVALYGFSFKTKPYRYEHSHNNQLK